MYEDCMERFSCNRAPDRCSARCYKPIKTHKKVVKVTNHNEHCGKNVIPNLRYVEGPPGRDGIDGRSMEFEWEGTRVKTRLEGEDNWTYSPNLQGIQGQQGPQGISGNTPYIGPNKTWWIDGVDTGVSVNSPYTLPKASKQILGGIRLTDDLEINDLGEVSVKNSENSKDSEKLGGQKPDYYAKDSEVQTLNTEGVKDSIFPNTIEYTVTKEDLGKRIFCDTDQGRRIILPSPAEAGEGSVVEVCMRDTNRDYFLDIVTPSGLIYKGGLPGASLVFQPGGTSRRYVSTGKNWLTNAEKVSGVTTLYVDIDAATGSDTELVTSGRRRVFKNFDMVEQLKEYEDIHVRIFGEVMLNKVIHLRNLVLNIYSGTLILPAGIYIRLEDATLRINQTVIKTDEHAFECGGRVNAILGGHESMTIRPYTDSNFSMFAIRTVYFESNIHESCTLLTISMCRCHLKTDNITDYAKLGRLVQWDTIYGPPPIFIAQNAYCGWGTKAANVYWHNSSDTLSRIGTSAVYTIG